MTPRSFHRKYITNPTTMQYYWWLIAVLLYLSVLVIYAVVTKIALKEGETAYPYADNLFFAIASVVTLSIIPLVKTNIYSNP